MIEGKIQTRSWDDKDSGQKKYRTEIIVNDLTLLGDSQGSENGNGASRSSNSSTNGNASGGYSDSGSSGTNNQHEYADLEITDQDVPF